VTKKREKYSGQFKFKVVLEAIKGQTTINEIASSLSESIALLQPETKSEGRLQLIVAKQRKKAHFRIAVTAYFRQQAR